VPNPTSFRSLASTSSSCIASVSINGTASSHQQPPGGPLALGSWLEQLQQLLPGPGSHRLTCHAWAGLAVKVAQVHGSGKGRTANVLHVAGITTWSD
jgi:type IV secretory pathway VirB2 component (pilin)